MLEFKKNDSQSLIIHNKDNDGDIEIEMEDGCLNYVYMYLDQNDIKLLIEHLTKQIS